MKNDHAPPRLLKGLFYASALVAALASGALLQGYFGGNGTPAEEAAAAAGAATIWTCSMHPQVRQPDPGLCPICVMDLIPLDDADDGEASPRVFRTSEAARALMQVETAPVQRMYATREVRLVGRVEFDETRLAYITAWVPGRIERMFADYTGIQVAQGDHMVELFSPELIAAKQELQRASASLAKIGADGPQALRNTARSTLEAGRDRLKRWGLTDAQIRAAETDGPGSDRITIYAPIGGTVIDRNGREGMFVETGTQLYAIADMGQVWLMLNAYESDLPWLHYGQTVRFTAEAFPGETFEGRVAFIDPVLDPNTRTVSVRVNVPNPDGLLKPGMFARAVAEAEISAGTTVRHPDLAGKWISPMHPEIIKDGPGTCDICGMALVPVEELAFARTTGDHDEMPLVIPATAPLVTGKRALVYVKVPDAERPSYEGREVLLGPRAREGYIVLAGVDEGEEVVVHGNFKIDSALEIQAKPSMMRPDEDAFAALESRLEALPPDFLQAWTAAFDGYLDLNEALASDDFAQAREHAGHLGRLLVAVPAENLEGDRLARWTDDFAPALSDTRETLAGTDDIEAMREALVALSDAMVRSARHFPVIGDEDLHVMNCPMAGGDDGADWIQRTDDMRNPYMGERMLVCGMTTERLPVADRPADEEAAHEH